MNLFLQITESLQTLTSYDDSDIVKGIIICFVLMAAFMTMAGTVYVKFFRVKLDLSKLPPATVNLTAVDALEITTTMAEKMLKIPVDGHTVEKRISKLHHDTAQALKNSDNATVAWMELAQGQKEFMKLVKTAYEEQAKRDIEHHKERMDLQKELNRELLKTRKR